MHWQCTWSAGIMVPPGTTSASQNLSLGDMATPGQRASAGAKPGQLRARVGAGRASPRRGAPPGRQRGFSPDELEPSTSEGELVSDLLQGAAAELSGAPSSSAGSRWGCCTGVHLPDLL